jgi:hypothetical protein
MDVNGDGRSDLAYPSSAESGKGTWIVAFGNVSGSYSTPINTGISNANWTGATLIDYNADGLEDLLVPYANSTWWVLLGTASGFSAPVDTATPTTATGVGLRARAVDIDGDGLQDLVWADLNGYAGGDAIRYRLRVLGGSFSSDVTTLVGPLPADESLSNVFGWVGQPDRSHSPDFNGDGRGDLTFQRSLRTEVDGTEKTNTLRAYVVFCPGGISFAARIEGAGSAASFGDFNGDGLDDLLYFRGGNSSATVVRFSTGTSFTSEVPLPMSGQYGISYAVLDWDGDANDDVLIQSLATSEWNAFRSTGETFASAVSTGIAGNMATDVVVSDVNGDGLSDLAYGVSGTWNVRTHTGCRASRQLGQNDLAGKGDFAAQAAWVKRC